MDHDNRESELNRLASGMSSLFDALDASLPSRVRAAIGVTSRAPRARQSANAGTTGAVGALLCPAEDHKLTHHDALDSDDETRSLIGQSADSSCIILLSCITSKKHN